MPEWKSFRKRQPIAFKRTRAEDIWKFLRQFGFSENNFGNSMSNLKPFCANLQDLKLGQWKVLTFVIKWGYVPLSP